MKRINPLARLFRRMRLINSVAKPSSSDSVRSIEYQRAEKLRHAGVISYQNGDYRSATRAFQEALRILRPLHGSHHTNADIDFLFACLLNKLANTLVTLGQHQSAIAPAQEAQTILNNLVSIFPTNREYAALATNVANHLEALHTNTSIGCDQTLPNQKPQPDIPTDANFQSPLPKTLQLHLQSSIPNRAENPCFAALIGASIAEVYFLLHNNLILPLSGLPPCPYVLLRRNVRQAFSFFEEAVPSKLDSDLRDLLFANLQSRSQFSSRITSSFQQSSLSATSAAARLRDFLSSLQEQLALGEREQFYCGLVFANLHFAATIALVAPFLHAAPVNLRSNLEAQIESDRQQLEIIVKRASGRSPLSYLADMPTRLLSLLQQKESLSDTILDDVVRLSASAIISFGYQPIADVIARELYFRVLGNIPRLKPNSIAHNLILEAHHKSKSYESSLDPTDLDDAITLGLRAVAAADNSCLEWAVCVSDLAGYFHERFNRTWKLDDLNSAIRYLWEALRATEWTNPSYWSILNNLGLAFQTRYNSGHELGDLKIAIDSLEQLTTEREPALSSIGLNPFDPLWSPQGRFLIWRTNYANALHLLAFEEKRLHNLNIAIEQFRSILKGTPISSPDLSIHRMNLANALRDRFDIWKAREDLDEAIILHTAAIADKALAIDNAPGLAALAIDLARMYDLDGHEHIRDEAITCFREAIQVSANVRLSHDIAAMWGTWAFRRGAWAEATEALSGAALLADERLHIQPNRSQKEFSLRSAQGLVALHAYALVMLATENGETLDQKSLIDAVLILENGQSRLLNDVLDLNSTNLRELVEVGREDLFHRYSRLTEKIQKYIAIFHAPIDARMPHAALVQEHNSLLHELESTIDEIRSIEGYSDFMKPSSFAPVRVAAMGRTLAYVLSTPRGGLAIVLGDGGNNIIPVWLQDVTDNWVLENSMSLLKHNELALRGAISSKDISVYVDGLTRDIGVRLKPLLDVALHLNAPLVLISSSLLAMLPLHLAIRDGTHLLDRLRVTTAPSARALSPRPNRITSASNPSRFLAVAPASNLPCNQEEAEIAARFFGCRALLGHDATRERIVGEVHNLVGFHFSGHAQANVFDPLQSSINLADGPLTVAEILERNLGDVYLTVLSACRSGVPGMELPDESVSLSTALLQVGVRSVISTLWVVGDYSSSMVMVRFYYVWKELRRAPSEALREAQLWVRDTTNKDKLDFFMKQEAHQLVKYLWGRMPEAKEHSPCWHWGGFVWSGEV